MLVESKLREDIIGFLLGKLSLDEFEDRFVAASWNMHQDSPSSAVSLASAVELRLAEYSSGHLPEKELKAEFAKLVSGVILVSVNEPLAVSTGSSFDAKDWIWQSGQPGGISLEVEYAY